jgi:hypothetical protein
MRSANNPPRRSRALPPDLLPSVRVRLTPDEISSIIRRLEENAAALDDAGRRTGVDFTDLARFLRDRAAKLRAALAEAEDSA